jgi:hypothetical protein
LNEELKIFIRAEIADLKKNLGEAQSEIKETASTGESGFKKFSGAAKTAGGIVASGLKLAVGAIAAAGAAMFGLSASTIEFRQNQAQLNAAFKQAELGAESAGETYKTLYGIIGDDDQAVESAANIAMLASSEEEAAKWAQLASGVLGTFHDTLQPEAFFEAANETLKLGEATGAFAQMLEQTGVMSVEDFNAELAQCATEAERQAFMLELSNKAMGEAGKAYEEGAADIIASNEAQAELNATLAELGAIATPIISTLKLLAADLLETAKPFVELIGEGLQGAFEGTEGASEKFAAGITGLIGAAIDTINTALPVVIQLVTDLLPVLLTQILGQLPNILQTILTIIVSVANSLSQMLPTLIPIVIETVLLLVETLLDNIDQIIDAGISLILGLADGLLTALPMLLEKIPVIIEKLLQAIARNLPKLIKTGIELTLKLAAGLIQAIPDLLVAVAKILKSIVSYFITYGKELLTTAADMGKKAGNALGDKLGESLKKGIGKVKSIGKDIVKGLWNGINDMSSWIGNKIQGFGDNVLGGIKDFFGIHSPSKVMETQVGKYLAEGIGVGFMNEIGGVNAEIEKSMQPLTAARSFSVHGAFDSLSPISAGSGNVAPVNSNSQWLDKLTDAMREDSRPIILKVGEKVLAEATFKAWNSYVSQTGNCPVKVW